MDIYDQEVERLTKALKDCETRDEELEIILSAWGYGFYHSPLFDGCSKNRRGAKYGDYCGCLTQVASGSHLAENQFLTDLILKDKRLPFKTDEITVHNLPVFAEWQRKMDKIIPGRLPPRPTQQKYPNE